MLYEEMPIPPGNVQRDWLQMFDDAQEGYGDALLTYHFSTGSYHVDVIGREGYGELSKAARLAVERER